MKETLKSPNVTKSPYDIIPSVFAPHPASINAVCATECMRWVFTASSDGIIRKYDFFASMNGKSKLSQALMHGFPDTVTRAGILLGSWDNEEVQEEEKSPELPTATESSKTIPIYSLEVHSQAVWAVAGLQNGNINLYTVRLEQGYCAHTFKPVKDQSPVNVLKILPQETQMLSASLRHLVLWDLNTGNSIRTFEGHSSQLTSASFHPQSKDGQIFLSSSFDGSCFIWDIRQQKPIRPLQSKDQVTWCLSACWSEDGQRIYCGRRNEVVDEWDATSGQPTGNVMQMPKNSGAVTAWLNGQSSADEHHTAFNTGSKLYSISNHCWSSWWHVVYYIEMFYLGAHVSAAKSLHNALLNTNEIKGNTAAFFLKSRKWQNSLLSQDQIQLFKKTLEENPHIQHLMPHGQYIMNFGNYDGQFDRDKLFKVLKENQQEDSLIKVMEKEKEKSLWWKSLDYLLDDIQRCSALGIHLYNFHPGSTKGLCSIEEGIENLSMAINFIHQQTQNVCLLVETMAGQGNILLSKLEQFQQLLSLVPDQQRIGICLDTCHLYSAGYPVHTKEGFQSLCEQIDELFGWEYVKGMHINDSKMEFHSNKDRHAHLGKGTMGWDCFELIMRHPNRFQNIPLILETPGELSDWKREIEKLRSFIKE